MSQIGYWLISALLKLETTGKKVYDSRLITNGSKGPFVIYLEGAMMIDYLFLFHFLKASQIILGTGHKV